MWGFGGGGGRELSESRIHADFMDCADNCVGVGLAPTLYSSVRMQLLMARLIQPFLLIIRKESTGKRGRSLFSFGAIRQPRETLKKLFLLREPLRPMANNPEWKSDITPVNTGLVLEPGIIILV